jgi:hypothetical protein
VRGVRTESNKGEWVDGPAFTTEAMKVPSELVVSDITISGAKFAWTASEDASAYEIQIGDANPVEVNGTAYTATNLNSGTTYEWKVRASNGINARSEWVAGTAFKTRTLLVYGGAAGYWGDYYAPNTENYELFFIDFDPYTSDTGIELDLDFVYGLIDTDPTKEFIDFPVGAYNFTYTPGANTVVLGYGTYLLDIVDGSVVGYNDITGGTMTIAGDHTGYVMKFDLTHTGGEFHADFVGSMEIPNPYYMDPEFLSRFGGYTANGTPAWFVEGESPTWSGELFDIGSNQNYGVDNAFNSGNPHVIDVDSSGNLIFNDDMSLGTATVNGTPVTAYGIAGLINPANGNLAILTQASTVPLEWDSVARTITFPSEMNISGLGMMKMMYGIMGRNSAGNVVTFFSELYEDLVLTLDPLPTPAGIAAPKYMHKVPEGRVSVKVKPVKQAAPMPAQNIQNVNIELKKAGYIPYNSRFTK